MTSRDILEPLLAQVEGATGADREIDGRLMAAICPPPIGRDDEVASHFYSYDGNGYGRFRSDGSWSRYVATVPVPEYTASFDAAEALVNRALPGWFVNSQPWFYIDGERVTYRAFLVRPRWGDYHPHNEDAWFDRVEAEATTAPLAILAALLKAKIAEDGDAR